MNRKVVLTIVFVVMWMIFLSLHIRMHENVHKENCEYRGFKTINMTFASHTCSNRTIDMINLDVAHEITDNVIASLFLIVLFIAMVLIWVAG